MLYYTTFNVYKIDFDGVFYKYQGVSATNLEYIKSFIDNLEKRTKGN